MKNSKKQGKKENWNFYLRDAAEEELIRSSDRLSDKQQKNPEQDLLHELRVHQIELEMQNDELRRTQEELESSRARYFDLYDLAPVGYVTVGENGLILEANLTAATLLGMERRALVNQPFSRFILPEDQDIYYRHRKLLLETGGPHVCELRMVRTAAAPFGAHLEATTTTDTDGAIICRVAVNDISERRRMEIEKAALDDRYRQIQKAQSLERMAGAIAHHFNNQLQVVMGNLEMALGKLPQDGTPIRSLNAAMQGTVRAMEVSKAMLTYIGQTPGKREPQDLSEICRLGLIMLRATAPKDVLLESDLPSPGPAISADVTQLQQVLTGLITNAWEALGDEGGAIRLTVRTVPPTDIPTANRFPTEWQPQDNAYACLEVTDPGCGIEGKDIESLFDPFFTTKFTGRGLGLTAALGIVRALHGVVTVESEPGRGSTFRIFLPVTEEKVPYRPDQAAKAPEMESGGTVLLVEDDQVLREVTGEMLFQMGFTVLEAKDGVEAVEVFQEHEGEIRCVLCDLTMPRMDGWATLAALRRLKPGIPVILVSGYDESKVMAGDHAELPQAFLQKPYHYKELRDMIGHTLARKAEGVKP
jgi:two-component system cell cycle sensor histidine kinase/response regulator CckA